MSHKQTETAKADVVAVAASNGVTVISQQDRAALLIEAALTATARLVAVLQELKAQQALIEPNAALACQDPCGDKQQEAVHDTPDPSDAA